MTAPDEGTACRRCLHPITVDHGALRIDPGGEWEHSPGWCQHTAVVGRAAEVMRVSLAKAEPSCAWMALPIARDLYGAGMLVTDEMRAVLAAAVNVVTSELHAWSADEKVEAFRALADAVIGRADAGVAS